MTHKDNKAAGENMITNELLKETKPILLDTLTVISNDILYNEFVPRQWIVSTKTQLHKKGDRSVIGNYRPISIMSNMYNVFSKVILNKITKTLDENQPREQAGFRRNFSILDHIIPLGK